jgi:LytB protein
VRRRFSDVTDPSSDTICYASQNRQTGIKSLAAQCDLVLVVGSRNSSNSLRMVEVAARPGRTRTSFRMSQSWTSGGWPMWRPWVSALARARRRSWWTNSSSDWPTSDTGTSRSKRHRSRTLSFQCRCNLLAAAAPTSAVVQARRRRRQSREQSGKAISHAPCPPYHQHPVSNHSMGD